MEAAEMLSVSPRAVRAWIADGRIKVTKLGRRVVIAVEELQRIATEGLPAKEQQSDEPKDYHELIPKGPYDLE